MDSLSPTSIGRPAQGEHILQMIKPAHNQEKPDYPSDRIVS
jgi:hypothetical protein